MALFSGGYEKLRPRFLPKILEGHILTSAIMILVITLLLVFFGVALVSVNTVKSTVDNLHKNPYSITVAAGQIDTSLVQLRTLSERLTYTRSEEAINNVESQFQIIGKAMEEPLQIIAERSDDVGSSATRLEEGYTELISNQRDLIRLVRQNEAADSAIESLVEFRIYPHIDEMLEANNEVLDHSRTSFMLLYGLINKASTATINYESALIGSTLVLLSVFSYIIKRKNIQQKQLRKNLQAALDIAHEASDAKSCFLASVSHDIRTPCAAIIGLTDIAQRHVHNPERVSESLEKIALSSHHLLGLINNVLDVSRIESGHITLKDETFSLDELIMVVEVIVRPQAKAKNLRFKVQTDCDHNIKVKGDALRIKQVLLNLIGNSVKYTEPGGCVCLRIEKIEEPSFSDTPFVEIPLRPLAEGCAYFRFEVSDDGLGMTSDFIRRVFEPFERERTSKTKGIEGTGLGMTIVKNIVDQMGGCIRVRSARGEGTIFTVDLPLHICYEDKTSRPLKKVPEQKRKEFAGVRVLLAEDNDINAEIACDILQRLHAEVEWVRDGVEAMEAVTGSATNPYDIVLMDVQMPRMDGLEASQAVRKWCELTGKDRIPIVAMTANAYVEDRRHALEAGMDDYLVKPITLEDVCSSMDALLASRKEAS